MAPTWQDFLMQYGPELGTIAGQLTRKGGPQKTPFQQRLARTGSESPDASIGAGMDTSGLAQGPYGNTENMTINEPGAYTPTGEGTMSSGAPSPTAGEFQGHASTPGYGGPGVADIASTILNMYGIAKSHNPNAMRSEFAHSYGVDPSTLPSAPETASRTHQAAHLVGTQALGQIPVAGPIASAAGGYLGGAKASGDYAQWYHQLMSANPQLHQPKMETPDLQLSGKEKALKAMQAAGTAVATYYGGPLGTAAASILHGASDKHFEEQRQKRADHIAENNRRYAENAARATRQMQTRDQAVANAQQGQAGGEGDAGGGFDLSSLDPQTQALFMLLGGQA